MFSLTKKSRWKLRKNQEISGVKSGNPKNGFSFWGDKNRFEGNSTGKSLITAEDLFTVLSCFVNQIRLIWT